MKKIFLTLLAVIFSTVSQAENVTFNEVLMKKQFVDPTFIGFTGYLSIKQWCLKSGTTVDLGTFQAAKDLEKLEDATFTCKGQFARLPYGAIKIFSIDGCNKVDVVEMKKLCPTKP